MLQLNNLLKYNILLAIITFVLMFDEHMIIVRGNVDNNSYVYNNDDNYADRNLRPPSYEDSGERNVDKLLLVFSGSCAPTIDDVALKITELLDIFSCLSIWISAANPNANGIYKQRNGDYKVYFHVVHNDNATSENNTMCIDDIKINFNEYCIEFVDYEFLFRHQTCKRSGCYLYPETTNYRWHRDKVDGVVDNNQTHIDTSSIDGVDIYILDTGVYWTHYEFSKLKSYTLLDPSFNLSNVVNGHGTHVAGIMVGQSVGISNHSLYDYPVCRGTSAACYSSYIDDAISIIVARALQYKRRGVINMSFASSTSSVSTSIANVSITELSTSTLSNSVPIYLQTYFNDTFEELVDYGIIPVAAAGNSGGNACNSWPASDPYVLAAGAYDVNYNIPSWSNYGSCVDIYSPGDNIFSSWIGSNYTYMSASGTSMASPMTTAIVADMLWYNNSLTFSEILQILQTPANNVALSSCQSSNPCYGIKINCSSLYSKPVTTMKPTPSPTVPTMQPISTGAPTKKPTSTSTTIPTMKPTSTGAPTLKPTSSTTSSPSASCHKAGVECTTYTQCCSKNCMRRECI